MCLRVIITPLFGTADLGIVSQLHSSSTLILFLFQTLSPSRFLLSLSPSPSFLHSRSGILLSLTPLASFCYAYPFLSSILHHPSLPHFLTAVSLCSSYLFLPFCLFLRGGECPSFSAFLLFFFAVSLPTLCNASIYIAPPPACLSHPTAFLLFFCLSCLFPSTLSAMSLSNLLLP